MRTMAIVEDVMASKFSAANDIENRMRYTILSKKMMKHRAMLLLFGKHCKDVADAEPLRATLLIDPSVYISSEKDKLF